MGEGGQHLLLLLAGQDSWGTGRAQPDPKCGLPPDSCGRRASAPGLPWVLWRHQGEQMHAAAGKPLDLRTRMRDAFGTVYGLANTRLIEYNEL